MNARYYDPEIGQFISPDTIVPDPTVLIDYNRFAYARANPLRFVDPSGHCVSTSVADVVCWVAVAKAAGAALAAVGTGAGGVLAIGVGVYGYQNTTFDLPEYDHSYDIPGTDLQASSIVDGSSTIGSGVPVINVGNEGFTLVDPPSIGDLIVTSRDTLRTNMGITDPNVQAHHIIPHSLSGHDLVKLANQAGWDINAAYNGIGLPDNQ